MCFTFDTCGLVILYTRDAVCVDTEQHVVGVGDEDAKPRHKIETASIYTIVLLRAGFQVPHSVQATTNFCFSRE